MAKVFVKSYSDNKNILKVRLESLLVLNVFNKCERDVVTVNVLEEFEKCALKEPLFEIPATNLKLIFLQKDEIPEVATYCTWPTVVLDVDGTVVSGLASVCRQIIKSSANPETIPLLGFREACLLACSEASIWTKFCEIDIISTVKTFLSKFNYVDSEEMCIPKDLSKFESHLNQPVRIHNVYKLARLKNNNKLLKSDVPIENLNLEHRYAEGPFMTLADLLLFPCYDIIFMLIDKNLIEKHLPLSVAWYCNLHMENQGTLLNFNLPKLSKISHESRIILEEHLTNCSLYKGDTSKTKQQSKIYTKQENIQAALSKTNNIVDASNEQFVSEVDILWSEIPTEANPLGGALPKSRANRKLNQLENLTTVVMEITKNDSLTIVDFCSGSGHLGILVATLLKNCRVILIENKERSLQRARERILKLNLTNVSLVQSNLDYFVGSFDIGMSLHACGVATDLVIQTCIRNRAHFVCCPCCYGSISNCHNLTYPRSEIFKESSLTFDDYFTICHSADQTHDDENLKTVQGFKCMNVIDTDRKLQAEEFGYKVYLNKLYPLTCTPKNNLLIGII